MPQGAGEIGLGLYPAAALANHACAPSCALTFTPGGGALVLRALRDLAPGDEVARPRPRAPSQSAEGVMHAGRGGEQATFAYVDPLQPRAARQALLRDGYAFECACALCAAPRPAPGAGSPRGDWAMAAMLCGAAARDGAPLCAEPVCAPPPPRGLGAALPARRAP